MMTENEEGISSGAYYSGLGNNEEMATSECKFEGFVLPGYFTYLSSVFRLITTAIILLIAGWVFYTIKITRSLHKPHNIFVANLMAADMMMALYACLSSTTMTLAFAVGEEDFASCNIHKVLYLPANVINCTYLTISLDKLFAITFPFKHMRMMTPRAIGCLIGGSWLLAAVPTVVGLICDPDGYTAVPYGTCLASGYAFLEAALIYILPIILSSFLTIVINVFMAAKAYKIHKQIERETRLSGINHQDQNTDSSNQKQANKIHFKPIITILVVVLGSAFINLFFPLLYLLGRYLIEAKAYNEFMEFIIVPNIIFVVLLLHPLVYGLYFKQVREPMMRCFRGLVCLQQVNTATVAPQPPRIAWM